MAQNLFKTRYVPNADGSESSTALTNANCTFVHTYLGDDNTGVGTRANPYRSVAKANLKAGVTYILFRGVINESFSTSKTIIGDDINQQLIRNNYSVSSNFNLNLTSDNINSTDSSLNRVIISKTSNACLLSANYSLFRGLVGGINYLSGKNNTIVEHSAVTANAQFLDINYIFIKNFLTTNFIIGRKFCVFSTICNFKYNGINIIQPNFTNDSKANITLLRSAYIAAGMTQTNANLLFPKDSFGNETCFIIKESRAEGSHPNIFNKYDTTLTGTITSAITANQAKISIQLTVADSSKFPVTGDIFVPNTAGDGYEVFTYNSVTINSDKLITFNGSSYTFKVAHSNGTTCTRYGDVLDFTLNPDPLNEALWASDTGGYVGCFRPAVDGIINQAASIIDVNADGTDTANAGTLMQVDASGDLVFNGASAQTWNRLRDANCINIPIGSNFKGLSAMSQDGSPFGHYLGKKQNLIDTTVVNAGDVLTVGQMYKVFNDSAQDVTKSVVYNGVQYLPEFTFICLASPTTFSLLNAGSGTYCKKVTADVLESIEILPYDDMTTPSAFPKFSAPLMGECKLLYYSSFGAERYTTVPYPKVAGDPVKFVHLSEANMVTDFGSINNKDSIYNEYAISNADQEFFTLANPSLGSPKNTYFTASIPVLRYLRREINGHFDQPYDY